jgi:hypothetical protein
VLTLPNRRFVAGWAFDDELPDTHLTVTIACRGGQLGTARCDLFRVDLLKEYGRGEHGFEFTFARQLNLSDLDDVVVSVGDHALEWAFPPRPVTEVSGLRPDVAQAGSASATSSTANHDVFPLFIIGSERSGTTGEQVRPQIIDCSLEVDQHQMELKPDETAHAVGEFLCLSAEQIRGLAGLFTRLHPECTVENRKIVGLAETGWSAAEQQRFIEVCGPLMQRYGYHLGPRYFRG